MTNNGRKTTELKGFGLAARALLLLLLLVPAGCKTGTLRNDKELSSLLEDLAKRNQEIENRKRDRQAREFREFSVTRSSAGAAVTLDLVDAPVETAFLRLMNESGTPYRLGDVVLTGRVTAQVRNEPLLDAVRKLTAPAGAVPLMRGDTLFLNYAQPPAEARDAGPAVTRNFVLKYLSPDSAMSLLSDLFSGGGNIKFSKVADLQSIYMSGPEGAVQQATDLLMRADRSPGSVQIEALIISVNSDAYQEFNSQFSKITKGRIANGKFNVWALAESSVEFDYARVPANGKQPLSFSAVLNMLFQQEKARIIARPYITVMNGQEAEMNIGENRYVVVQQPSSGAAVYGMQAIEAGVKFKITPRVLGDLVRMDIDMSNKQFVPTQGNVGQVVNSSGARTVLTLDDGQTAIIGGLKMKSEASANAGLPWLRRIPLLNLLTAAHEENQSGQEVFFYLTPHIVKPGMDGPPDRPEAFGTDNSLLSGVEKLQR